MLEQFADDGWEFPRILNIMKDADDFYFDCLRQVHLPRWSHGHVVLTGDAAWCPTPLSGIGTTLAMVGGYILAGEMHKNTNCSQAFAHYETAMRPFVKEGQNVPQIIPRLLWPQTPLALKLMRASLRLAATPWVKKALSNTFARDSKRIQLPTYASG